MTIDVAAEFDVVVRLLMAAALGALIGLEREIHEHPAGMRTHLLVALGSAGFTVLSVGPFSSPGGDPGRVAAQIVSGVGFLGAGAILKEGATIRGLTTAASLWTVAAVGMAAGVAAWGVAVAASVIVVVSLWPLRIVADRFVGRTEHRVSVRLSTGPHGIGRVVETITAAGGAIAHLASDRSSDGDLLEVTIEFRTQDVARGASITAEVGDLDGVDIIESKAIGD